MAQGNPLLVTYVGSDRTFRSYELSGGVFVQIGTGNLTAYTSPGNVLHGFIRDGSFLVSLFRDGASTARIASRYPSLTAIGSDNLGNTANWDLNPGYNAAGIFDLSGGNLQISQRAISSSGQVGTAAGDVNSQTVVSVASSNFSRGSFSPDGEIVVVGKASGTNSVSITRTSLSANGFPQYASAAATLPLSAAATPSILLWSSDSRFLFHLDTGGVVSVFRRDGTSLNAAGTIGDSMGTPLNIAVSADTRWLAVSYTVAGSPVTAMYRRTGNAFQKLQTLSGTFGTILGFTADSRMLIDAGNRRAFTLSGTTWSEDAGAMVNIAAGATIQAISPHIDIPVGVARLYDNVVGDLIAGGAALENLKIALLNGSAVFDQTDAAWSDISANEVYGSGWPQGGKSIGNVTSTSDASSLTIKADDIAQTIIEAPLTFRSAALYDSTGGTNRLVSFIDFQAARTAEVNTSMKIEFGNPGFIFYSI